MLISFELNHERVSIDTDPCRRLLDVLRNDFLLTGTKEGCGEGECGTCTILFDNEPIHACLTPIGQVAGHSVLTIEGLTIQGKPDPLQEAFVQCGAIHCGFCTPGMIMMAKGLLLKNPTPSVDEIRIAIAGNICRCSNYEQIIDAILCASRILQEREVH